MVTAAPGAAGAPAPTDDRPAGRHWVIERLRGWGDRAALIWRGRSWSYERLAAAVDDWRPVLDAHRVGPGAVVALVGDYSPRACALLLALLERRAIVVPLGPLPEGRRAAYGAIAEVRHWVSFGRMTAGTGRTWAAHRPTRC